ncbi:hypothetical protein HYQ45_015502 [Verticillium longisporum]|uniref:Nephrocystin 3-like N-terminal domain-containing protein n=1 Tax=Verticillium longisporum TaxID=100787 RepID=A0A8I2ZAM0_VERLO|nr:hypothetical protein HYQ45_015502 [Verticillium longisporum]
MQLEQSMHRSREERQQLLVYLSSHDYKTPFQIACKKHQYNTAEWIFTTPEFERWHDGTGPSLLWCSGKRKTILCANVINHVLVKKGSKDRVTYFFLHVDKDLRDRFPRMGRVSMTSDCVASDIRLYIDAVVDERVRDGELAVGDPLLLETIKETLSEHADGMFLWVKFLISDVCNADCDDDIRESLRNLPKDLEAAFTRALSRIPGDSLQFDSMRQL